MFVISTFLIWIAKVINLILGAYWWIIVGRVIISWVNADPYNPIVLFLYKLTEPLLSRIRRFIPIFGGIDLSPLVILLGIWFVQDNIVPLIFRFANNLG
jgi:YggT family protein